MPKPESTAVDLADLVLLDGATGAPAPLAVLRDVNVLVLLRHRH